MLDVAVTGVAHSGTVASMGLHTVKVSFHPHQDSRGDEFQQLLQEAQSQMPDVPSY